MLKRTSPEDFKMYMCDMQGEMGKERLGDASRSTLSVSQQWVAARANLTALV